MAEFGLYMNLTYLTGSGGLNADITVTDQENNVYSGFTYNGLNALGSIRTADLLNVIVQDVMAAYTTGSVVYPYQRGDLITVISNLSFYGFSSDVCPSDDIHPV